jgi:hypothetical protein
MGITFIAGSLSEVVAMLEGNNWKDWVFRMMVGASIIFRLYRGRPKRIELVDSQVDKSVE